jgi:hypothetical protein
MGLQSGFQPKIRFRIAHPELLPVAVDAATAACLAAAMLTGEMEGDYHFTYGRAGFSRHLTSEITFLHRGLPPQPLQSQATTITHQPPPPSLKPPVKPPPAPQKHELPQPSRHATQLPHLSQPAPAPHYHFKDVGHNCSLMNYQHCWTVLLQKVMRNLTINLSIGS